MHLNFAEVKTRIEEFRDCYLRDSDSINRYFCLMESMCQGLPSEEKLYFIFLITHFDHHGTADSFYQQLHWCRLLEIDGADLPSICHAFFEKKRTIGDHRRHFRCMPLDKRVRYTMDTAGEFGGTLT